MLADLVTKVRAASPSFNQIMDDFAAHREVTAIPMHSTILPLIDCGAAALALEANRDIGSLLATTMSDEAQALINFINTIINTNGNFGIHLDKLSSDTIDAPFAIATGINTYPPNVDSVEFKTKDQYSFQRLSAPTFVRYDLSSPEGEALMVSTWPDDNGRYKVFNSNLKASNSLHLEGNSLAELSTAKVEILPK